jgi:hypothetical protein
MVAVGVAEPVEGAGLELEAVFAGLVAAGHIEKGPGQKRR